MSNELVCQMLPLRLTLLAKLASSVDGAVNSYKSGPHTPSKVLQWADVPLVTNDVCGATNDQICADAYVVGVLYGALSKTPVKGVQ